MFWYDEANERIIFHSNLAGRIRANLEHNPKVCLEASEMGRLLPSNVALEFSVAVSERDGLRDGPHP